MILNWNGGRTLVDAVASVLGQSHDHLELIVVDNGSTDDSLENLPSDHRVLVVRNGENLGYARGMNVGWQASSGTFWIPMNDDAILHPDFVEQALRVFQSTGGAGAVAPLVLRAVNAGLPWDSPGPVTLVSGPESTTLDMRVVVDLPVDQPRPTFKANGACPVYRSAALAQVIERAGDGPFDPWFDTYGEDLDLCFRLHALGWTTVFAPTVLAAHQVSGSSAPRIHDKRGRLRRNLIAARHANAWRHLPILQLVLAAPLIAVGDVVFMCLSLLRRDGAAIPDIAAAWARVARGLPALVRERRRFPPQTLAGAGELRWASRRETILELSGSTPPFNQGRSNHPEHRS